MVSLDIAAESPETYVIDLQHGDYTRYDDRFRVMCSSGKWQVSQYARGLDGPWLEPAAELPGQRGDLTPALVSELGRMALTSKGPWFAQVATGSALVWERLEEIRRAQGLKPYPPKWRGSLDGMKLKELDATHAEAWLWNHGVRFEKVGGLWKIADYTEGGEWVGLPDSGHLAYRGPVFDPPFGVLLGNTNAKAIEQLFGPPDSVKATDAGTAYVYNRRKIDVQFNSKGKVAAFSMKTGAPHSGVRIGSPVELWELIYRPQDASGETTDQQLKYTAQDGKVVEITVTMGGDSLRTDHR